MCFLSVLHMWDFHFCLLNIQYMIYICIYVLAPIYTNHKSVYDLLEIKKRFCSSKILLVAG